MPKRLKQKINLTVLRQLQPGDEVRDPELRGFGARRRGDAVSFFVQTRINGRQRWFTIGQLGNPWTAETARNQALQYLADARRGVDAGLEKERARKRGTPFEAVAQRFLELHGPRLKPRTLESYRQIVRSHLIPAFCKQPFDEITKGDVANLHAKMGDTKRTANHTLAVLSKMMSWAEDQGIRPENTNPCRRIAKYRENRRERYLSGEELVRLGSVLNEVERDNSENLFVIACIRLLILTGARLSEIRTLQWSFVNEDRRLLILPDSKTGAKTIPLSTAALEILKGLPRLHSNPYVLPGHVTGQCLINIQKPWRRIRCLAGLDDVRLHDLRHSFASFAVEAGGTLPVIGRVLGHSQPQTTARYAHVAHDPAAHLAEVTGARIATALFGNN